MAFTFTLFALVALLCSCSTSAFSGNFELHNLTVSSPFQADPTSTESTYIQFDFYDQDTPEVGAIHCCVDWAVGLTPPTSGTNTCDNSTFIVFVMAWHGVGNMSLQLGHQYIDDSIGQAPYNVLSKYSVFNLTYPATTNYECDMKTAACNSCDGQYLIANITSAVA